MSQQIAPTTSPVAFFNKIPWTFLIILYLLVVHFAELRMDGIVGYIFLGIGVFVLFAEFFKSGDISTAVFFIDVVMAVVGVVISTWLLTWLYMQPNGHITFFHWFGYAIILGDAIVSPFNSFRTALRNIGFGD